MSSPASSAAPLLAVEGLRTRFDTAAGVVFPVDGISFSLEAGRTLGLVGESGSGKSLTARSILGLLPADVGRIAEGSIRFRGEDLARAPEARLRALRGQAIAMVFQEPMSALNPLLTVGEQIAEVVRAHRTVTRDAAWRRAVEVLEQVGIREAAARARVHPHQLSGGMRQRVVIAMALACEPALVLADEPTTALDVTVQAQVLALLKSLQRANGMALLLITHDLAVVAETCDDVAVMYAGRIVERAPVASVLRHPAHPYTAGLLASVPRLEEEGGAELRPVPGTVPPLHALPSGCRFRDRCPRAQALCAAVDPVLEEKRPGQLAACHFPLEGDAA